MTTRTPITQTLDNGIVAVWDRHPDTGEVTLGLGRDSSLVGGLAKLTDEQVAELRELLG